MATCVVLLIIIVWVLIGIRNAIRHMKGEGGCCGGSSSTTKVKKQKLQQVIMRKEVQIDGMTCKNCKRNVENCLNRISYVNAKVNLKKQRATLLLEKAVSNETIESAIRGAGYRVISIKELKG